MQMVIPAEARPLLSAATAVLVSVSCILTNAIFAKRRTAACVYCFTWTNRILNRMRAPSKMKLSDAERNTSLFGLLIFIGLSSLVATAKAALNRNNFHKVSRAAGPKMTRKATRI
jgi:hypothetical protein